MIRRILELPREIYSLKLSFLMRLSSLVLTNFGTIRHPIPLILEKHQWMEATISISISWVSQDACLMRKTCQVYQYI